MSFTCHTFGMRHFNWSSKDDLWNCDGILSFVRGKTEQHLSALDWRTSVHGFSGCCLRLCKAPKVSTRNSCLVSDCRHACALSCFSQTARTLLEREEREDCHRSSFTTAFALCCL